MSTTPTTTNEAAVFFDGLVQAMITGGEDVAKAYILTTPAAFLEGPVIDVFTNWILDGLADAVYQQTANLVTKVVIDIQTDVEKSEIADAVASVVAAKVVGDPNALAKAYVQFDSAVANLIHSDGSVPSS